MKLSVLRARIDRIDETMVRLLNARTRVALDIGAIKRAKDLEAYSPAREKEVFSRVAALNKGPLRTSSLRAIYREIMSAALSLEKPIKVAHMGPVSSHSHQAALARFGGSVQYVACPTIRGVFDAVTRAEADHGVVPVGDSGRNSVLTLACLADTRLTICSEICIPTESGAGRRTARFLVLGGNGAQPTGDDKTSVLLTPKGGSGVWRGVITKMRRRGVRMTEAIGAAPGGRPGSRPVFVDIEGHVQDASVMKSLDELERHCERLKILGSYPKSKDI